MKPFRIFILSSIACLSAAAIAGPAGTLQGSEVTESALIEALKPGDDGTRTRSIKVLRDQPATKPGSVSLLIVFRTNSTELTPQAKSILKNVGRALNSESLAGLKFNIEGHADPRGDHEANRILSQKRAEAVRQFLSENVAVDSGRLVPIGKGDKELLNAKNPAAPENRRVTFVTMAGA